MRRKFGFALIGLLALLIGVALAGYFLAYTERGLTFLAEHTPRRIGRAELEFDGVRGTLYKGVEIERFELRHERTHWRLEGIRGRASLLPLLWQTIEVPQLTARYALVEVFPRRTPPVKYEPRFLPRLLTVRAGRVEFQTATFIATNGKRFDIAKASVSGVAQRKSIRFYDAALDWEGLRGTGNGELLAADPMQIRGATRWIWDAPEQPTWTAVFDAEGDLDRLGITGNFLTPFRATVAGAALTLTRDWRFEGRSKLVDFDLRAWGGGDTLGRITGDLALGLDREGFTARGPLHSAGLMIGPIDMDFAGSYSKREIETRRLRFTHRESRSTIEATGVIGIVAKGPRLALEGGWKGVRWPLERSETPVRSAAGKFSLRGIWPYELVASGPVETQDLAPMPLTIEGLLGKDGLIVRQGVAQLFGGSATFSGEANWDPRESWSVNGRAAGIDPAKLRADLPGRLEFNFLASGDELSDEADLDITIDKLGGRLRGAQARGGGHFLRREAVWSFDNVNFGVGGARLALDGQLGLERDLRFTLETDDLSLIQADSRGRIRARGTIAGSSVAPRIDVKASGSAIRHADLAIGDFSADVAFDARPERKSRIELRGSDVKAFDRNFSRIEFDLAGHTENHQLRLAARAGKLRLAGDADAAYAGKVWSGRWRELGLDDGSKLRMKLEAPASWRWASNGGELQKLCLGGAQARACAEARWDAKDWSSTILATGLPLAALAAGLTPRAQYDGAVNVNARVIGQAGGTPRGELHAELAGAAIRHRRANGKEDLITLGAGVATAVADRDSVKFKLQLDARPTGTITGEGSARRSTSNFGDMPLTASLRFVTDELGFVSLFVPEIDRASGSLDTDLVIGGTLGAPRVSGTMRLKKGELDLYQVNLALREAGFEARLIDNKLSFSGSATAGGGGATASGELTWRDGLPYGTLKLIGKSLRIVDVPEARIDASPNLAFEFDGRRVAVVGEVNLPYARIVPADLAGAVRASPDESIVGARTRDPAKSFQVASAVRMTLGDDVDIQTYGLSGRITGSIDARSSEDDVTRATGELNVAEGKYIAYGRRLDIQRGRLIFTGGLVTDPGVDIRAVKQFPDVIAGINVRGTLRQPRMTFFSEPALPQSQVVSLILAGGSLEAAQSSQKQGATRHELLVQGGAILAQQLGSKIGIEDVSIEQNLDSETSLVLGKYLSPRLYFSYGISLAESINTIKMRYTLGDRWTIKTEAGQERSADLVYTIEK